MYSEEIAHYYDLEHEGFEADAHMYLSYAMMTGGPVLELGCGTGRLMEPLVSAGHEVVGVDSSEAMLQRARERLADQPPERWRLVHSELAGIPPLGEQAFGMAFCALNTWAHLSDLGESRAVLQAVHVALRTAGLLLIDLEDPAQRPPGRGELWLAGVFEDGDAVVTKMVSSCFDAARGVEEVTFLWDRVVGGALTRSIARTAMRPYSRAEMELLLEGTGYSVREVLGSWELEPYSGRGDRLILVAERLET